MASHYVIFTGLPGNFINPTKSILFNRDTQLSEKVFGQQEIIQESSRRSQELRMTTSAMLTTQPEERDWVEMASR